MESTTREALEYAVQLATDQARVIETPHGTYTDRSLKRIDERAIPAIPAIGGTTLASLIEYIHGDIDELPLDQMFIQIDDVHTVSLNSALMTEFPRMNERDVPFVSKAHTPRITYEQFMPVDKFIIMLQSCFLDTLDRQAILKFVGALKVGDGAELRDDGVSQQATIKTGVANLDRAVVPNPVTLRPYRTFVEAEQPESEFVFRVDERGQCALFEADGGMWKVQATNNIKNHLRVQLESLGHTMMIVG